MGASISTEFIDLFKNDWFLLSDLSDLFIGNFIANGSSRSVYHYNMNNNWVVKIDRSANFNNVSEWDIWHNMKDTKAAKYLAPCHHISSCGRVMLQSKTKPVTIEMMPKRIPAFFADTKVDNWGRIGNNIVCHDYANHAFFTDNTSLVNAKWW